MIIKISKIMLAVLVIAIIFNGCISCNGYKKLNNNESIDYLNKRFKGSFELVSSETIPENEYAYLDEDMKRISDMDSDIAPENIKVLTIKDKNGISFHMTHIFRYGISSHYEMWDDYCVQWLKNQSEIYEPLINSDYECEYYNEIGYAQQPRAGFILHIDNFYELQPAIEFAYSIVTNKAAILPDYGNDRDDIDVHTIYPEIMICTPNDVSIHCGISNIDFNSLCKKDDKTLEEYIEGYNMDYVDLVREGLINEKLPDDILKKYGPESISTVTYSGEDMGLFFYRDTGSSLNIKNENSEIIYYMCESANDDETLDFPKFSKFANCSGYTIERLSNNELCFTNGTDKIAFIRKKGKFSMTKNGKNMNLKGNYYSISGTSQIVLTTEDLYSLLGIKVEIDMVHGTAKLIIDE